MQGCQPWDGSVGDGRVCCPKPLLQRVFANHLLKKGALMQTSTTAKRRASFHKAKEVEQRCAVCQACLTRKSRTVSRCGSRLVDCLECGSWTFLPRPTPRQQAELHDNEDYFEHPYFEGRRTRTQVVEQRCRELFSRIGDHVDPEHFRGLPMLDIGCDTGDFIAAASRLYGVRPLGVDVAGRAVEAARDRGVEAYCGDLQSAPEGVTNLPLITAIDLIEHLTDPADFLREAHQRLAPDGYLYLETPNIGSLIYQFGAWLSRRTGGRPSALIDRLFPPQHVEYFTQESLAWLAKQTGYRVVAIGKRALPFRDLGVSLPLRIALSAVQGGDSLLNRNILLYALLQRPTV